MVLDTTETDLPMSPWGMLNGRLKIGETLRKLRGKTTRIDLATMAGVSAHTIQMIEEGRSKNPTIETVLALCGALKVSPIDFLKHSYPNITEPEIVYRKDPNSIRSDDVVALINGFARVSNVKRAIALSIFSLNPDETYRIFRKHGFLLSLDTAKAFREFLGELEKKIIADQSETS